MRVGRHEAIHDVGFDPSTMNSGARTICALFGASDSLWNSACHLRYVSPHRFALKTERKR